MRPAVRRVRGRLAPEAMFPAGVAGVRVRRRVLGDGLGLRVAESGDAGAPPVLLLHGWGASIYMWRDWFAPLAAAGFRAIAVDLPGHGLSDKPAAAGAYSTARQTAVLRELFATEGLAGAPTVAQSMGGSIALALALDAGSPVGPLALVNAPALGRVRLQRLARAASPALIDPVLGYTVPRWIVARAHRLAYAEGARVTRENVEEYWAPSQDPAFARAMRRLLHEFTWTREPADRLAERLAARRDPVLALIGGRDKVVHDALPYATAVRDFGAPLEIVALPRCGHAMNEEEPDVVVPIVLEWLMRDW